MDKPLWTSSAERTAATNIDRFAAQVADIPLIKSAKIVELAVRKMVHGRTVKKVRALASTEAFDHFRGRVRLSP